MEQGIAKTQFAYRRQKSCIQTLLRRINSVSEARNRKENSVLTVMDFGSCYERIWRAGLLKKASNYGICGRLWMYIKNFLTDRKYYIKVNDFTSTFYPSAVGIPQGSVISPILCNLCTSDAMEGVRGMHAEYADDNCVWDSSKSLEENCVKMNVDLQVIESWCLRWNMLIAPEKTEVILFTPGNESVDENEVKVKFGGEKLRVSKSKKVLGVIIDDKLNFSEHIAQKN